MKIVSESSSSHVTLGSRSPLPQSAPWSSTPNQLHLLTHSLRESTVISWLPEMAKHLEQVDPAFLSVTLIVLS